MDYPLFSLIFKHKRWWSVAIHQAGAVIGSGTEFMQKVPQTPGEPALDVLFRDIVTTMIYALSNPEPGQLRSR